MRSGQYQNMRGNSSRPSQPNNPIPLPLPDWLCPHCSLKLISRHLSAQKRDVRESNSKQIRGIVEARNYVSGTAGPSRGTGPVVQLGVLEPRVENGRPCPPTLDLLGVGKSLEDDKNVVSEKTIIDLDPACMCPALMFMPFPARCSL